MRDPRDPKSKTPNVDEMLGILQLLKESSEIGVQLEAAKAEQARLAAEIERSKADHIQPMELMRFLNTIDINCIQIVRGILTDNETDAGIPATLEAAFLVSNYMRVQLGLDPIEHNQFSVRQVAATQTM